MAQAKGGFPPPCCCEKSCSKVSVPYVLAPPGCCAAELVTAPDRGWGHTIWAQCICPQLLHWVGHHAQ